MLGSTFYHSTLRKYVIMFGAMFDDITIRRWDKQGVEVGSMVVPIAYSAKRRWAVLLRDNVSRQVEIQLPRLGFQVTSMNYDATRKTSPLNRLSKLTSDRTRLLNMYNAIPYKITFELYATAKNMDDVAQINEQIIPYFNQDFSQSLDLVPEIGINYDILTRLTGTSIDAPFEGDFQSHQYINWSWVFEVDAWFFGPVTGGGPIKRVHVDLTPVPGSGKVTDEEMSKHGRASRIEVTPGLTANGTPTTTKSDSIPYLQIQKQDNWGYVVDMKEFDDGLKYDPVTDTDKPIT